MQVFVVEEHHQGQWESLPEMFVKRGGVRMHPEPKFVINGLELDEEYVLKLRLELADDYQFAYQNDAWHPVASAGSNAHLSRITDVATHRALGAHWHSNVVHFDHLRITSELSDLGNNMIYVEPYHKYVPVLSVIHTGSNSSVDIRFEQLKFIAVNSKEPIVYNFGAYPSYVYQPSIQYYPVYYQELAEQQYTEPYTPEYGWNSVLMPEKGESVCYDAWELFHHHVWAPREMELEELYYQTEHRHLSPMYYY